MIREKEPLVSVPKVGRVVSCRGLTSWTGRVMVLMVPGMKTWEVVFEEVLVGVVVLVLPPVVGGIGRIVTTGV